MSCRVLSIQSSVVFGYVGNKSATFPLQVLGFDVSAINSVQFSNHTVFYLTIKPISTGNSRKTGHINPPDLIPYQTGESSDTKPGNKLPVIFKMRFTEGKSDAATLHWQGSSIRFTFYEPRTKCRGQSKTEGYGNAKGQKLNSDDLALLLEGLRENKVLNFSHLLTGYVGNKSFLEKVGEMVQELRNKIPDLLYVCDPVMGDNGHMYVPKELLPVYRDLIVPLADIVTPNQFEIQLLTDKEIHTEDDALEAMNILHSRGVKTVVLSSTDLGTNGKLVSLASTNKNGKKLCYKIDYPQLQAVFVGTGDLFAACLLAWIHKDGDLKLALEKTIATVQAVIHRTLDHAQDLAGPKNKPTVEQMELRLIQSKNDIENPEIKFHCTLLNP